MHHRCAWIALRQRVSQEGGTAILQTRAVRSAWERACKAAGLEGRLVHDLRRTAARDFRRAGVSEGEIMRLCGWKTRDMFDRYNIIDQADLTRAVARRFSNVPSDKGKGSAQNPPA